MTSERRLLEVGLLAALMAFLAAVLMGFLMVLPEQALSIQPSYPPVPAAEFLAVVQSYPEQVLRFYAADTLFVLSYLLVFAALYGVTAGRVRVLATVGLGAGIVTAVCDATENGFFVTYGLLARQGVELTAGELPLTLIFMLGNLKWMAAFVTLAAFGLALPRDTGLGRLVVGLMLLFPLVGVLGIAFPALTDLRGLFLLFGMLLFAAYFRQQLRQSVSKPGGMKK